MALAIAGSVCGTLITRALDTSQTASLIGAILGGAIPTLITVAGPYHRLRAGLALLVTIGALFITYGGFTLFDFASDRKFTFPVPDAVAPDGDHDGFNQTTDCDDNNNNTIFPGAGDMPGDGIDQNCDDEDGTASSNGGGGEQRRGRG